MRFLQPLAVSLLVFCSACQCGGVTGTEDGGSGAGSGSGGGATGGGSTGTGGGLGTGGSVGTGGNSGTGGGGGPSAEVCDGIDNDQNAIIDDVDVGMDGVCDCLKIATLGYRGQWGTGDVFHNWLDGKSLSGAADLSNQTLTDALLAPFQVIVVQDVRTSTMPGVGKGLGRAYSASELQAIRNWVSNGGGLMTLIGYGDSSEVTNVNAVLQPFGMSYGTTQILPKTGGSTVAVSHWEVHPLATMVMKIGVDNGYEVSGGTLVASEPMVGQYSVGRATAFNSGRVFVWGDEWLTYDSEWTQHTDYQLARFWLNSIKWLTPPNRCQVEIPLIN